MKENMKLETIKGYLGKTFVGLSGLVINSVVWAASFNLIYFAIMIVVGSAGSVNRFNRSRGSFFDTMALHSSAVNPLKNAPIDGDVFWGLIYLAFGFSLIILVRTFMAPTFRHGLLINLYTWSNGLLVAMLSLIGVNYLANGSFGDIVGIFYYGVPLFLTFQFIRVKVVASFETDPFLETDATPAPQQRQETA